MIRCESVAHPAAHGGPARVCVARLDRLSFARAAGAGTDPRRHGRRDAALTTVSTGSCTATRTATPLRVGRTRVRARTSPDRGACPRTPSRAAPAGRRCVRPHARRQDHRAEPRTGRAASPRSRRTPTPCAPPSTRPSRRSAELSPGPGPGRAATRPPPRAALARGAAAERRAWEPHAEHVAVVRVTPGASSSAAARLLHRGRGPAVAARELVGRACGRRPDLGGPAARRGARRSRRRAVRPCRRAPGRRPAATSARRRWGRGPRGPRPDLVARSTRGRARPTSPGCPARSRSGLRRGVTTPDGPAAIERRDAHREQRRAAAGATRSDDEHARPVLLGVDAEQRERVAADARRDRGARRAVRRPAPRRLGQREARRQRVDPERHLVDDGAGWSGAPRPAGGRVAREPLQRRDLRGTATRPRRAGTPGAPGCPSSGTLARRAGSPAPRAGHADGRVVARRPTSSSMTRSSVSVETRPVEQAAVAAQDDLHARARTLLQDLRPQVDAVRPAS